MLFELCKSSRKGKKYMVRKISTRSYIHFGDSRYQDFTQHHDEDRRQRYLARHRARENWTKSGINSAGFFSRWLLWSERSLNLAIKKVESSFGIKIKKKKCKCVGEKMCNGL